MLSVLNPNAAETLDAGVIIRIQICELAPKRRGDTGRASYSKAASRPAKLRSANQDMEILSTWTQTPDSTKSAVEDTERKDQIRVL